MMPSSNAMHPPWPRFGVVGWEASPQTVTLPTTWVSQVDFSFILCQMVFLVKCSRAVLLMHRSSSGTWKCLTRSKASCLICSGVVFRQPRYIKCVTNNSQIIVQLVFKKLMHVLVYVWSKELDVRIKFLTFRPISPNHQPKHFGWGHWIKTNDNLVAIKYAKQIWKIGALGNSAIPRISSCPTLVGFLRPSQDPTIEFTPSKPTTTCHPHSNLLNWKH